MSNSFRKCERVVWQWGTGEGSGSIAERFDQSVTRTLKGSKITLKGDADNPAYLIKQDDGDEVLKLGSELKPGGD
jgi:hypothetical protein